MDKGEDGTNSKNDSASDKNSEDKSKNKDSEKLVLNKSWRPQNYIHYHLSSEEIFTIDPADKERIKEEDTKNRYKKIGIEYPRYYELSFWQILLIKLKESHFIGSAFIEQKNIWDRLITISNLFATLLFSIAINTLFYSDDNINVNFRDDYFDFFYEMPKVIYCFLMGILINLIFGRLSYAAPTKKGKTSLSLISKLSIYFATIILSEIFLSYFIWAFCGVYRNSQTDWILWIWYNVLMAIWLSFLIILIITALIVRILKKKSKWAKVIKYFMEFLI